MSNKMNQIRRDGFQNKLELDTSYEETDNLIETFNEMMYQIEASFNQQRQFVEDASHELRTPLQIIQGHLNLIKRWGKKDRHFRRVFKYFIRRNESNYKASRRIIIINQR